MWSISVTRDHGIQQQTNSLDLRTQRYGRPWRSGLCSRDHTKSARSGWRAGRYDEGSTDWQWWVRNTLMMCVKFCAPWIFPVVKGHRFHRILRGYHDSPTVLITATRGPDGWWTEKWAQRDICGWTSRGPATVYMVSSTANFPQLPKGCFPNIYYTTHWSVEGWCPNGI